MVDIVKRLNSAVTTRHVYEWECRCLAKEASITITALRSRIAELEAQAADVRGKALEDCLAIADRHDGKPCRSANGWTAEQRRYYDAGQIDASSSIAAAIRQMKGGEK